jgi:hypothetical protein
MSNLYLFLIVELIPTELNSFSAWATLIAEAVLATHMPNSKGTQ